MLGTMFCQFETPCGWCTRLNKECLQKREFKKKWNKVVNEDRGCKTREKFKEQQD